MGHSQLEKLRTHERILDVASKRFRERGLEGISISDIMKEAGITVGGFYKHFPSKEALVSEAVGVALSDMSGWNELARVQLDSAIDHYLSSSQYDDTCACTIYSSLAADIRRSSPAVREVFDQHVGETLDAIEQGLGADGAGPFNDRALTILAALVGASLLARGTSDSNFSRKVLKAVSGELHLTYFSSAP
jgi:TetR/AcrR family transcriptional repressor of nem operon